MRIMAINPSSLKDLPSGYQERRDERLKSYASPGTEVVLVYPDCPIDMGGYAGMKARSLSEPYAAGAAPFVAREAIRGEKEGFDGILVLGPWVGGELAKHVVKIPVVDTGTSTLHVASLLGDRICVLVPWKGTLPYALRMFRRWNLNASITSVKAFDMFSFEMSKEEVFTKIINLCKEAVEQEDAHVIVPLCGPSIPQKVSAKEVEAEVGVPVLDHLATGVKMIELIINLKLNLSQKAYPYAKINF